MFLINIKTTFKRLLKYHDVLFLWAIFVLIAAVHFYPLTNKYDLLEEFSPALVIMGLIALGCAVGWLTDNSRQWPSGRTVLFLLLFAAGSLLAFAFGEVKTYGFAELFVEWGGILIFLYFSTKKSLLEKHFPIFLAALMALHAAVGIRAYLMTEHTRFFGMFYNPMMKADAWPNSFAFFFLLIFPILAVGLWKNKNLALALPVTGFMLGLFGLSLSRAAILALAVEVILMVTLVVKNHDWKKGLLNKILIIGAIFLLACGTFYGLKNLKEIVLHKAVAVADRLVFQDQSGGSSFSERKEFFEGAFKLIANKPLLGYGLSSFKWVYPRVQQGFLALSDHPHNFWLNMAVERGLPVTMVFLLFVISLFWRDKPFSKDQPWLKKAAWVGLIGAGAHAMVDHNLNFISNQLLLWFFFALVAVIPAENGRLKSLLSLAFGLALSAAILLSGAKITLDSRFYQKLNDVNSISTHIDNYHPFLPRAQFMRLDDKVVQVPWLRKKLMTKELEKNPDDAEAYLRLGDVTRAEGDLASAAADYKTATERNPKNSFLAYLRYAQTGLSLASRDEKIAFKNIVFPLIAEYKRLYAANLHFTRSTKEIEHARKLESLLNGISCKLKTDCQTPMEFMIQSNCPFTSACIEGQCAVVCPIFEAKCALDSDCQCSERGDKSRGCRCLEGSCASIEG